MRQLTIAPAGSCSRAREFGGTGPAAIFGLPVQAIEVRRSCQYCRARVETVHGNRGKTDARMLLS
jgi:hypothetical protein